MKQVASSACVKHHFTCKSLHGFISQKIGPFEQIFISINLFSREEIQEDFSCVLSPTVEFDVWVYMYVLFFCIVSLHLNTLSVMVHKRYDAFTKNV
jgi:hypothetical protein